MKNTLIASLLALSIGSAYAYSELPDNLKVYLQNGQVSVHATPINPQIRDSQ